MVRKIIHVDMDAFFASIEQRDNPDLRGKPVAVGGSAMRGVVAAASYEARQYGVRSAMPSVTARRLCPDLIFVKSRFEVYKEVSMQIKEIFAEYTPLVEPLSLDEAYLEVTHHLNGKTAFITAKEIRRRIFEQTGLTASAGVSYNKFFAKLASDMRKPNGQYAILPEDGMAFIENLQIGKFHGIGPATEKKMIALGINNGLDLRNTSLEFLTSKFGKSGTWYYNIARGIDDRTVKPDRIRKSYGSEKTFNEDLTLPTEIASKIEEIAGRVWLSQQRTEKIAKTLTLKVKYNNFRQITKRQTISDGIKTVDQVNHLCEQLIQTILPIERPIRLLGLTFSNFTDEKPNNTLLQF